MLNEDQLRRLYNAANTSMFEVFEMEYLEIIEENKDIKE